MRRWGEKGTIAILAAIQHQIARFYLLLCISVPSINCTNSFYSAAMRWKWLFGNDDEDERKSWGSERYCNFTGKMLGFTFQCYCESFELGVSPPLSSLYLCLFWLWTSFSFKSRAIIYLHVKCKITDRPKLWYCNCAAFEAILWWERFHIKYIQFQRDGTQSIKDDWFLNYLRNSLSRILLLTKNFRTGVTSLFC